MYIKVGLKTFSRRFEKRNFALESVLQTDREFGFFGWLRRCLQIN
jgi:hypothetical protein